MIDELDGRVIRKEGKKQQRAREETWGVSEVMSIMSSLKRHIYRTTECFSENKLQNIV